MLNQNILNSLRKNNRRLFPVKFKIFFVIWFSSIFLATVFLSNVQAIDPSVLIEIITAGSPAEKEKAKSELFDYLQKKHFPENYGMSFKKWLLFKNIYGGLNDECVVALETGRISTISIFKKGKTSYFETESLPGAQIEEIGFKHLTDNKVSELITDKFMWATGWHSLRRFVLKYDGKAMKRIWWGVLEESRMDYPGDGGEIEKAKVFYRDLDNDGIKEIIREGSIKIFTQKYNNTKEEWELTQKSEKEKFHQVYKWNPKNFKYELLPGK